MVLRVVLGALYVVMAAGQLVSWPVMPDILSAYHLVPAAGLAWLAAGLIGGELVAGVWLLARSRSAALTPAWVFAAVAAAWAALAVQAYVRGLDVDNCGCFGRYLTQRLSWFTLAQDGLLLLYAVLLLRAAYRARAGHKASTREMVQA